MLFSVGQKFYSRGNPARVAEAVQVFDGGHEALVQVREQGQLVDEARVNMAQMPEHWTMCEPGPQKQVYTEMKPF